MDKKELQQLRALRAEIKNLEKRIEANKFSPKHEIADTVKDYRTGKGKPIAIHGYGNKEWQSLQIKYKQKKGEAVRRVLLIEMFMDKVEDSEMRQILRYRYEDGLTQEEIGEKMGYSRQAIQKREERFWNEHERRKEGHE